MGDNLPHAFAGAEGQLWLWLLAMVRPGAAFLAAPVFGSAAVPVQLRLIISLAIGMAGLQVVPFEVPVDGVASIAGISFVLAEVLAGLALGFAVQMGFSSALLAGEVVGNTMGLGFAAMVDPVNGAHTNAVGQFLNILATFLFLAIGGHLMLASIVIDSYRSLPPGGAWLAQDALQRITMFGGDLFAAGLAIALPVAFSLTLVQLVMAVLARSAPALNLFAVGIPAALLAGVILLAIAAPGMADGITASMLRGLDLARAVSLPAAR